MLTLCAHAPVAKRALISLASGERPVNIPDDVAYIGLEATRILFSIPALIKTIWQRKPDIIVTSIAHLNFLILLLKPFLPPRTKFIVRESTAPGRFIERAWMGKRATLYLYQKLYPVADIVLCPSTTIVAEFKKLSVSINNQKILFNPVDEERVRTKMMEEIDSSWADDTKHFICVGRLDYAKGYDRLLSALANSPPRGNWDLTIIGEGPERKKLEMLIENHSLTERVFLLGAKNNPYPWMARADALLLPSRWEGMPNVVLESLAAGTRVIATTEAGGIVDIAAQTKEEVRLLSDVEDFPSYVSDIECKNRGIFHPSLLPDAFHLPTVLENFKLLLNSLHK